MQLAPSWPAWDGTGAASSSVQGSCPVPRAGAWAVSLQSTAGLYEAQRLGTATVQHARTILSVCQPILLCLSGVPSALSCLSAFQRALSLRLSSFCCWTCD